MANVGLSGFEMNDISTGLMELPGTGCTFDTTTVRTGTYSGKVVAASSTNCHFSLNGWPSATAGYVRFYILVTARPATTARVIQGIVSGAAVNLRLNPDGTIAFFSGTTLIGTSSTALTDTARWYRVDFRIANGSSVTVLRIDGNNEVTGSPSTWSLSSAYGANDTVADTYTAYFDDIAWDDAAFPPDGRVVLLLPISDNARATLWTGGVGGTTSLFEAVNNTPPIGTATETDLTQIEHAGGAAGTTDAYDANMTSYTTAGIRLGDLVNTIVFFIIHGEDIATGTKLLNFSLVSNPAQATSLANFTAGADVGALGTYGTNWTRTVNGSIASPTVTLGTSPVMRVVRPETASRVASVCFMGMYVDYTPGSRYPKALNANQARNRAASF